MTRQVSAERGGARLHWVSSTAKPRLLSLLNEAKRCLVCFLVPDPVDSSNPGVDTHSGRGQIVSQSEGNLSHLPRPLAHFWAYPLMWQVPDPHKWDRFGKLFSDAGDKDALEVQSIKTQSSKLLLMNEVSTESASQANKFRHLHK